MSFWDYIFGKPDMNKIIDKSWEEAIKGTSLDCPCKNIEFDKNCRPEDRNNPRYLSCPCPRCNPHYL